MSSNIPESLLTRPMATVSTMNVETSVLEPTLITPKFARFVLERKGILDTGSVLKLQVKTADAAGGWLPIKTGIHAAIERATLRIGSKIVAITDQYSHYQTMRRAFKTTEEKSLKDMVKAGTLDAVAPSPEQDGTVALKDALYLGTTTAGLQQAQYTLTNSDTTTPEFTIKLSELFPMMRNVQLPLYVINEPCSIEVTFKSQANGTAGVLAGLSSAATTTAASVVPGSVQFLADYLTYDDDRMSKTAAMVMSKSGMVMPYEDVVLTTSQIPAVSPDPAAGAVAPQNIVRDLGLSGMSVRGVLVHLGTDSTTDNIVGQYKSEAFPVDDSVQVRVNDRQIYPRELTRVTQKQHQLSQVFNTDLSIHSAECSFNLATDKTAADRTITNKMVSQNCTLGGRDQAPLEGSQYYLGFDLTSDPLGAPGSGTTIGQKPLQMLHTIRRTADSNAARQLKYYSLVERQMVIKGGQVMVSA